MKNRALVLQHVASEGPERIAGLCREQGLAIESVEIFRAGTRLPSRVPEEALLVVMGGPMNLSESAGAPGKRPSAPGTR